MDEQTTEREVKWLDDEEQAFWRLLLTADRKIRRGIEESLLYEDDLSHADFGVLVNLSEAEGHCLRIRELCEVLGWDRSRTSHQITRMEKRGLVAKSKHDGDGRGVVAQLTDLGMQRVKKAAPAHVATVRHLLFDVITAEERRFLAGIAQKIVDRPWEVNRRRNQNN